MLQENLIQYFGLKNTDGQIYNFKFVYNDKTLVNSVELRSIFDVYSDHEIYFILTNKTQPIKKFVNLFDKIKKI